MLILKLKQLLVGFQILRQFPIRHIGMFNRFHANEARILNRCRLWRGILKKNRRCEDELDTRVEACEGLGPGQLTESWDILATLRSVRPSWISTLYLRGDALTSNGQREEDGRRNLGRRISPRFRKLFPIPPSQLLFPKIPKTARNF